MSSWSDSSAQVRAHDAPDCADSTVHSCSGRLLPLHVKPRRIESQRAYECVRVGAAPVRPVLARRSGVPDDASWRIPRFVRRFRVKPAECATARAARTSC